MEILDLFCAKLIGKKLLKWAQEHTAEYNMIRSRCHADRIL